jgi:AraC-like DNA-binding protein
MSTATATSLPLGLPPRSDGTVTPSRPWPRRRRWLQKVSRSHPLTTGCRAWLLLLSTRSDDLGKPVWGTEEKMAEQMGMSERTVRRYVAEALRLGFIKVKASKPLRNERGEFYRRASNVYYLVTPKDDPAGGTPPPRRIQKAGYCVLKSRSHLQDSHDLSTAPVGAGEPCQPPAKLECSPETGELIPLVDPEVFHTGVAQLKLALAGKKPGGLRR